MSGSGGNYPNYPSYYHYGVNQKPGQYNQIENVQNWDGWSGEPSSFMQKPFQGGYNNRVTYPTNAPGAYGAGGYRNNNFHGNQMNRSFQNRQRYNSGWQSNSQGYKRSRLSSSSIGAEEKKRKKKKSVRPQNPKREWTAKDAARALTTEKELNRNNKSSLIIKFPDQELNRDIVQKFHPSIENVHFRNPYTPRFCFITLQDNVDADKVIEDLNKIPFGCGFLSAEYKKGKKEEQGDDIDPLTLYVGNLAPEITVEDLVSIYPNRKRVDIGFAQKMKYTRYAFVCFKTVDDAIEAFKNTHNTELYNRSLIVRFNRLHGAVGMPSESKAQNPKIPSEQPSTSGSVSELSPNTVQNGSMEEVQIKQEFNSPDVSDDEHSYRFEDEEEEDEERECKPDVAEALTTPYGQAELNELFKSHTPITVKQESGCIPRKYTEQLKPPIEERVKQEREIDEEEEEEEDNLLLDLDHEIKQEPIRDEEDFNVGRRSPDDRDIEAELRNLIDHQNRLKALKNL